MREDKKPCRNCHAAECTGVECEAWREDFAARWDQTCQDLREKTWRHVDQSGKNAFRYELPHEVKDPCKTCICQAWCNTPCSLRLKWWNICMRFLRRTFTETVSQER